MTSNYPEDAPSPQPTVALARCNSWQRPMTPPTTASSTGQCGIRFGVVLDRRLRHQRGNCIYVHFLSRLHTVGRAGSASRAPLCDRCGCRSVISEFAHTILAIPRSIVCSRCEARRCCARSARANCVSDKVALGSPFCHWGEVCHKHRRGAV